VAAFFVITGGRKSGVLHQLVDSEVPSTLMASSLQNVVLPTAGLGTRLLPATKVVPKELLPLVDKPVIQYAIEEAVALGVTNVVLVTNPENTLTAAHFSRNYELETILEKREQTETLDTLQKTTPPLNITSIHQTLPLGLGHAVLMSRNVLNDEPFAVILPDDVIHAEPPVLQQMTEIFQEFGGPVLLVERVPRESVNQYGIIDASIIRDGVFRVNGLVEKPEPSQAPSDLAIIGRYILTSDVFQELEQTREDEGGEIQLTDGLRSLSKQRPLYACELSGVRHDVGSKLGYLKALLYFGLKHPDLEPALREYIKKIQ